MATDSIKIASANCRGLGSVEKRNDVFNYLKNKKYNIICLQDTHFTKSEESNISAAWGYNCFFSSLRSNARGVSIFFTDTFEFKLHDTYSDDTGNVICLDITVENVRLTLINIYAPNEDNPMFFDNIKNLIHKYQNSSIILCGDFNLVLNPVKDLFNYKHINNPRARSKVTNLIEEEFLCDIFRHLYPDKKRYTWRQKTPFKQARLDFFLLSDNL